MFRRYVAALNLLIAVCCNAESGAREVASSREVQTAKRVWFSGDFIADWNQLGYDVAFAEDQFTTFKGQRAFAMMHLAQHDALNAIVPRFETYALDERNPHAHPIVAAAQAAHDVLVDQYPSAAAEAGALLLEHVGPIAGNVRGMAQGIKLGRKAARSILSKRKNDGWEVDGSYSFLSGPGTYQTTPDWRGFVLHPGLAAAMPFMLRAPAQLRPAPPPTLASRAYARAFHEVKVIGAASSKVRTSKQTAAAIWWMEFSEGLVNRYARHVTAENQLELWRTARLFALLNAALVDTYIAVWDSKYAYNHWRPYTAIRQAAADGNPITRADSQWESLRPAPPFPEYVSAHAAGCACTFRILSGELAEKGPITLDSLAAPLEARTRTFSSLHTAAQECASSRVWLGFHFRYATDAGTMLGRRVAQHAISHHLRRIPGSRGDAVMK
jgi:hypothetical protein